MTTASPTTTTNSADAAKRRIADLAAQLAVATSAIEDLEAKRRKEAEAAAKDKEDARGAIDKAMRSATLLEEEMNDAKRNLEAARRYVVL